ncbi:MAG: sugar kinase [Alphaproteobacteria bacterium]|nr:sugar kinase [Alphaproteobacteria bacterium]
MPKPLLCLGIVTWDMLFRLDEIPTKGIKVPAKNCVEVGGGMSASAAVAIARLGGKVHFWGRCGDDPTGDRIADDLRAEGVDVSNLKRIAGKRSPVSAILIDRQGERLVVPYYDPTLDPSPAWLPVDRIGDYAAVLSDVRWPEGVERGLKAAHQAGVLTILDGEVAPAGVVERLAKWARHIVFSQPGLAHYGEAEDRRAALLNARKRSSADLVGVTAGANGFYWLEGDDLRHVPSLKVDAVDTLAAGDVFHGAYGLALTEGKSVAEAGRFACVAAALKCRSFGSRSTAPGRDEVEAALA